LQKKRDEAPANLLMKGYCASKDPRYWHLNKINKLKTLKIKKDKKPKINYFLNMKEDLKTPLY